MRRAVLLALGLSLAVGCRGTVIDHLPVDIRLPSAPQCRDAVGTLTLTGLGDFPTTDLDVAQLDGSGAPLDPITRFRTSTLAFSVSGRATGWDAFGWAMRGSLEEDPTVVLAPLGRSCPLADSEARLPAGAAAVVIDDARVMIVGGLDETGQSTRRVAILHVRDERVELPRMDDAFRTAFAAATLVPEGDAVLVTGGATRDGGDAQQSWERIPLDGGALTFGSLRVGRRDHAALAIDHGRVLVVGGSDGPHVLGSIEWVDASAVAGDTLDGQLSVPRTAPVLVPLDASHVAVAGGRNEAGASVAEIEVIDLASGSVQRPLTLSWPCSDWAPVWVAPLPSGRVLAAGPAQPRSPSDDRCDTPLAAFVISIVDSRVDRALDVPDVLSPVVSALPSGRVLLEGRRTDGTRLGFVIDPGAGTIDAVDTSRVPSMLLALADGATLELAVGAASLRRDEGTTPFDGPPLSYLFGPDRDSLALDAAGRWVVSGPALTPATSVDDARLDIPVLRMRDLEAVLDAEGDYDVVLTGPYLETVATIAVSADRIALGSCSAARTGTGHVRIAAHTPGAIELGVVGGPSVTCPAMLPERVGVGIVAHAGASLRSLALSRE